MDLICKIESKKAKFVLSLFAAAINQLAYAVMREAGVLTVYFLSYIHYQDEWVDINYGNLMRPVIMLFLSLFSPLSGPMENLFGPRLSILISTIILEGVFTLLYFQRNLYIFYLLSFFLGLGGGLSNDITLKNACSYYPRLKGLIGSSIMSFGFLAGAFYIFLFERIINPNKEGVIDRIKQPYYSESIGDRSRYYFLFGMIMVPASSLLTLLLFYRFDPSTEEGEGPEQIKGPLLGNEEEQKIEGGNENKENKEKEEKEEYNNNNNENGPIRRRGPPPMPAKGDIKKALTNFKFWRNVLISGVTIIWPIFLVTTFRPYVVMMNVNTNVIAILAPSLTILGSLANPIWALCVDKFGFQPIIKVIAVISLCISIYFTIFMDNKTFYTIGLFANSIMIGGIMSTIIPHLMQVYGLMNFLIIGGFFRLFNQFFFFFIGILSIVLSFFFKNALQLKWPYRFVSITGIVGSILGFVMAMFENDDKFDYGHQPEESVTVQGGETDEPEDDKKDKNEKPPEEKGKESQDDKIEVKEDTNKEEAENKQDSQEQNKNQDQEKTEEDNQQKGNINEEE